MPEDFDWNTAELLMQVDELRAQKDGAYAERNQLAVALAKVFPSHVLHDESQEQGWQAVLCVHTPNGQATWHFPDSQRHLLDFLKGTDIPSCAGWDGHTTEEKYQRLAGLRRSARGQAEQTSLAVNRNCTDWRVRADTWDRGDPGFRWMRADNDGHPVATLRQVGWLDQKGRVYPGSKHPRGLGPDWDGGSLTPLLIDAREDGR